MRIETLAVHAGAEPDPETGALAPPIHLATTFVHPPDAAKRTSHLYTRYGNPTQDRLEVALAALEGGAGALAYGSGMAAAAAMLRALRPGHLVLADDVYFSVRTIATELGPRWGMATTIVDATDLDAVRAAIQPHTRCIWIETPSNPRLKVVDIAAVAEIARAADALLVVDATFATPVLQRTLELGADVALHSCTKYMGGHSDVLAGALVLAERGELFDSLHHSRTLLGGVASPMSSWLVLRGLRSLPCRMEWHCRGAQAVAGFLAGHPAIERVHYPGLPSHPGHALAARQMPRGAGGVLSFEVRGGRDAALAVASRLQLFINATSLGGTESLVEHRASIEGQRSPTPGNLLRLAVGLEHPDDLIADLDQALSPR
jgi:cystathionine gamma-synthase